MRRKFAYRFHRWGDHAYNSDHSHDTNAEPYPHASSDPNFGRLSDRDCGDKSGADQRSCSFPRASTDNRAQSGIDLSRLSLRFHSC